MPTSEKTNIVAVVLAGASVGDPVAAAAGVSAKALAPAGGRPLALYLLEALRACRHVDRIVFVGDAPAAFRPLIDAAVPAGHRMVDSVALGAGAGLALAPGARLLLLGVDLPWLDGQALERFLDAAPDVDLVYPIVERITMERAFPGQPRTYVRLREGRFTGGNLMLLTPAAVAPLLHFADRAYRARKNAVALAAILGLDVVLSLLLGRAQIDALQRRAERLLGVRVAALVSNEAALAADVDAPAHLAAVDAAARRREPA